MNLRDLEYFVALAEHRHFGRAAAACYVSQPTLSTQVKKLEAELGLQLIERSPRQVMLTAAGELVVGRARVILAEVQDIRGIARQAADPRSGSLRLGIFPTLGPYLLPHIVGPVHQRFPDLELLLVEEKTDDLHELLRAGRLDVAILALPVHDESLHAEPLFREEFVLAVPAVHALAGSTSVPTTVLRDHPVLLLSEGHCLRDQALEVCHLVAAAERDGFQATSLETLRHMVSAGVGITLLPELSVAPPVPASPDLALVRFESPAPYRDIAAFWRRTSVYGDLLPELVEVLRAAALPLQNAKEARGDRP